MVKERTNYCLWLYKHFQRPKQVTQIAQRNAAPFTKCPQTVAPGYGRTEPVTLREITSNQRSEQRTERTTSSTKTVDKIPTCFLFLNPSAYISLFLFWILNIFKQCRLLCFFPFESCCPLRLKANDLALTHCKLGVCTQLYYCG